MQHHHQSERYGNTSRTQSCPRGSPIHQGAEGSASAVHSHRERLKHRIQHSAIDPLMSMAVLEYDHPSFQTHSHRFHRLRSCRSLWRWIGRRSGNRTLGWHVSSLATPEASLQCSWSTATRIRLFARSTSIAVGGAPSFPFWFSSTLTFSKATLLAFHHGHLFESLEMPSQGWGCQHLGRIEQR